MFEISRSQNCCGKQDYLSTCIEVTFVATRPMFKVTNNLTYHRKVAFQVRINQLKRGDVPVLLFYVRGIPCWSHARCTLILDSHFWFKQVTLTAQVKSPSAVPTRQVSIRGFSQPQGVHTRFIPLTSAVTTGLETESKEDLTPERKTCEKMLPWQVGELQVSDSPGKLQRWPPRAVTM